MSSEGSRHQNLEDYFGMQSQNTGQQTPSDGVQYPTRIKFIFTTLKGGYFTSLSVACRCFLENMSQ